MATAAGARAECRLALVLALDVSSSVDQREYDLQKLGLATALNSIEVRTALLHGIGGHVELTVYEWSGRYQQEIVLEWTRLDTPAAIDHAVSVIAQAQRSHSRFPTAIGYALGYGAMLLQRGPACKRQVIDVSGDGVNNEGFGPDLAYRNFPMKDVTVNGLVILGADSEVLPFYRREVRRGPGAFVETARGFEDFAAAMTRKLWRELNDVMVGGDYALPEDGQG
ncbi:von Willebrand factor A [Oceanicola sp. 22II-s10i]|nr:von Willebrand factor A [Oceanicola sp. 22II-s10i]